MPVACNHIWDAAPGDAQGAMLRVAPALGGGVGGR